MAITDAEQIKRLVHLKLPDDFADRDNWKLEIETAIDSYKAIVISKTKRKNVVKELLKEIGTELRIDENNRIARVTARRAAEAQASAQLAGSDAVVDSCCSALIPETAQGPDICYTIFPSAWTEQVNCHALIKSADTAGGMG